LTARAVPYVSVFDVHYLKLYVFVGWDKYAHVLIDLIGKYTMPGASMAASQVVAFTMFWFFGVSMSLFNRAMAVDGDGVHFNTEIFC